ncbi:hypothetical protein [Undibacterium sp. TC9W]|uniref:hypothetical protein n=1 Tax=Undibacterium sp. TC9W TaxID=3413053 RepID=UPI003BF16B4C
MTLMAINCSMVQAAGSERWDAVSNTAASITGNIEFSPVRLRFQGGQTLELALQGKQKGFKADGDVVHAQVYKVLQPVDLVLQKGNRLCGGKIARPVRWVLAWTPEALPGDSTPLGLAFSSGETAPTTSTGADSCGTYNYELAAPTKAKR